MACPKKGKFQKEHITNRAHSKEITSHKKGTFQKGTFLKEQIDHSVTKGQIPNRTYSKNGTFQK